MSAIEDPGDGEKAVPVPGAGPAQGHATWSGRKSIVQTLGNSGKIIGFS